MLVTWTTVNVETSSQSLLHCRLAATHLLYLQLIVQHYFLYLWSFRWLEETIVFEWIIAIKINLILLLEIVRLLFQSHRAVQVMVVARVGWRTEIAL